ncbi:MAG: ShlB/FhaC/HecB family hemolysin secretion/activation protein [Gallionella sp.]
MRNVHTQIKPVVLTVLLFAQLGSVAYAAPPDLPDAGQTMRELQHQPELTAPKAVPPLRIEEPAPKTQTTDDVRMMVKSIRVSGSTVFTAKELEALLADLIGGEHSIAELVQGITRITDYYHERGYVVARAYLPPQEIRDGALSIEVLEGRIGEQHIHNQSRLSDQRANDYLRGIRNGDVLLAAPVDHAILLLNDTPGVGVARATLQPGASVGTTDLVIELDPSVPYAASIELDDHGNYYTGEYRIGAALIFNSPLKMGDQLTLNALTSDQNMDYARVSYSVAVGGRGLKLGAAYSGTSYRLGKEFSATQSHGTASSSSLFASYPFMRSQAGNLFGTVSWEKKQLSDDTFASTSDKQVLLRSFGLNGNHQDTLGGAGNTSFDLTLVQGRLSMDATSSDWYSLLQYQLTQTNGAYHRIAYNVQRQQRLTDTGSLSCRVSGQRASKNLNSSEQFSLGGVDGVRAYPQGEASGDQGWLLNLELRHGFQPALQGVLFYDVGSVDIKRNPYTYVANIRNLSGAGIGANAYLAGVQIKAYLAWRTDGGQPTSEPASLNRNPRLWLQLSKQF